MKLSKLYCNKDNFKSIEFNLEGLNVIYAEVKTEVNEKKNSHDLGKTKLAEIIDFLLLKSIDKHHFLLKIREAEQSIFYDYVFYLELQLISGQFLTIKRNVATNTKISFSLSEERTTDFSPPKNWDYRDIAFKKSKKILSEYLKMDFFFNKEYDYRKSISYSLRTQDDFKDVYKLNKFTGGKDIDWKPFMFDLLGFNGDLLKLKYENDLKIDNINQFIDGLKNEFSVKVEERDEIVAEKSIVENEHKEIESQIDKFNFYQQDKELINQGIEKIEKEIGTLNSISYRINKELEKLKGSIKNKFSFDVEKVKKVFEETQIYFPDQLTSDYNKLLEFNNKLTTERNKLLKETITAKQKELDQINKELIKLNKEREDLLSNLSDSDTFTKFKYFQKELVKVEGRLLSFNDKLDTIDKIIKKEDEIESYRIDIKETIDKIRKIHQTTDKNVKYSNIRALFTQYYKRILDENAVLSWSINTNNNVDFIPPKVKSKLDSKKDTAKDEGNTYMKLLCVAFDLAILTTYNYESYFRFVYHDDVLSQQDNGIKIRLLELINELNARFNLQYIMSVIKSDLPTDQEDRPIEFTEEEIILKLHDKDQTGTLFGFEF